MLTFLPQGRKMNLETVISVRRVFASTIEYHRQNAASNYPRRDDRLPMICCWQHFV